MPAKVPTGMFPGQIQISPDGASVYVSDQGEVPAFGKVWQYDVGSGGTLTPKDPPTVSTTGQATFDIALSPDGRHLYAANAYSDSVSRYDVGAGGRLAPRGETSFPAGSAPDGLSLSPDGGSLYVIEDGPDNIAQFDVAADGALTPKAPARVSAPNVAGDVTFVPAPAQPTAAAR